MLLFNKCCCMDIIVQLFATVRITLVLLRFFSLPVPSSVQILMLCEFISTLFKVLLIPLFVFGPWVTQKYAVNFQVFQNYCFFGGKVQSLYVGTGQRLRVRRIWREERKRERQRDRERKERGKVGRREVRGCLFKRMIPCSQRVYFE